MKKFKVSIETEGLTSEQIKKITLAGQHFEDAMNSEKFKLFCNPYLRIGKIRTSPRWRFWNKTYKSIKTGTGFKNPEGRTDLEVYSHLLAGSERLNPGENRQADIKMKIDKRNKRGVLGYTYTNSEWQWIYKGFFDRADHTEIAGNMAHEWFHKMGYGHAFRNNSTRRHTVPYAIGYFVRDFRGD